MEGISGVTSKEAVLKEGPAYEEATRFMTGDVNACIEGALEAGAQEILVKDAHFKATNIKCEMLNKKARLIRGWDILETMVSQIDETFQALLCIGYHGRSGSEGTLAHTYSGDIENIKVNEQVIGEIGLSALLAGHYNVPLVLVSGDATACQEAKELLGKVETVVVKKPLANEAASILHPERACELIKEATKRALSNCPQFKPFKVSTPIKFTVSFTKKEAADLVSLVPQVKKLADKTVVYTAKDPWECAKIFRVFVTLAYSLRS